MPDKKQPKEQLLSNSTTDLHPDAWERFERAVDQVAKSPPQPRSPKAAPSAKREKIKQS
jgi:hypothetical protein